MSTDNLHDAVRSGDRRVALESLRDVLAATIDSAETPAAAVAALSKQLADVLATLDGLKVPEVSKVDELAAKRAARRASLPDGAPEGVVSGE